VRKALLFFLALCVALFFAPAANAAAGEQVERYIGTWNYDKISPQSYKGWPVNWWATYFIKEFDKYAPAPGADWLTGSGRDDFGPQQLDWIGSAAEKGWVISVFPSRAKVGAIGISIREDVGSYLVWLGLVREVRDQSVVVSMFYDGQMVEKEITYEELRSSPDDYIFRGYIFPEKKQGGGI
jgi:hypothetical protein